METLTITLADKEYTVQPLTIGQLRDLHVGIVEPIPADLKEGTRQFWERNLAIISKALEGEHPEMTPEVLSKMRLGNIKSVKETVDAILVFTGLSEPKKSLPELRVQMKALEAEIRQREQEAAFVMGEGHAGTA